jgi:hypothetical protein
MKSIEVEFTPEEEKIVRKWKMLAGTKRIVNEIAIKIDTAGHNVITVGKFERVIKPINKEEMELLLYMDSLTIVQGLAVTLNSYATVSEQPIGNVYAEFCTLLGQAMNTTTARVLNEQEYKEDLALQLTKKGEA